MSSNLIGLSTRVRDENSQTTLQTEASTKLIKERATLSSMQEKAQAIIYRNPQEPEILLLKRKNGAWHPLTGGRDPEDDSLLQTLKRELHEETGIKEPLSIIENLLTFTFNQTTETAYAVEIAPGEEITFEHNPCDEHDGYEWTTPQEAMKRLSFETQKQALKRLLKILEGER